MAKLSKTPTLQQMKLLLALPKDPLKELIKNELIDQQQQTEQENMERLEKLCRPSSAAPADHAQVDDKV